MSSTVRKRNGKPNKEADQSSENAESRAIQQQKSGKCRRCVFISAAVFGVLLSVFLYNYGTFLIDGFIMWRGYERAKEFGVPQDIMDMFFSYDNDGNGAIDPFEFMFVVDHMDTARKSLLQARGSEVYQPKTFEDQYRGPNFEYITVRAEFEPIVKESMSKFNGDDAHFLSSPEDMCPGLMSWKAPHIPAAEYGVRNFAIFTPPTDYWSVGKTYYIINPAGDDVTDHFQSQMSPHRYHPPTPSNQEAFIYTLMLQFHPNPFVNTRFGPKGTLAVLRAKNQQYWDILIRSHVEFQLNSHPNLPFWFTPGQFAGRLVIARDLSHIYLFELSLPANRTLNIDMEWLTKADGNSNEVDIGYVPKMRLLTVAPSHLDKKPPYEEKEPDWEDEISEEEGRSILEKTMYPFKEIAYLPFTEAFDAALREDKLVHHLLLWGALDDQSC